MIFFCDKKFFTMSQNILKVYGTLRREQNKYTANINYRKRSFPFKENDEAGESAAKKRAQLHLVQQSILTKRTNKYWFNEDKDTCFVELIDQNKNIAKNVLKIDANDIDKLKGKTLYCKTVKNGADKLYVIEKNGKHTKITNILTGQVRIGHRNDDEYDCRQCNLACSAELNFLVEEKVFEEKVDLVQKDNNLIAKELSILAENKENVEFHFDCFCFESGPFIESLSWNKLKNFYEKHEHLRNKMAQNFAQILFEKYPKLPPLQCNEFEAFSDFKSLQSYSSTSEKLTMSRRGLNCCKFFYFQFMVLCKLKKSETKFISPVDVWEDEKMRKRIVQKCFILNSDHFDFKQLWGSLVYQFGSAINFRPAIAKQLYEMYASAENRKARVLDMCAGWGGRLLGALASEKVCHYTGIDPNCRAIEAGNTMFKWLQQHDKICKQKTIQLYNCCAEDESWTIEDKYFGTYDIMLTSPPYFDMEVYETSASNNQSITKYPNYDQWLDKFVKKIVQNSVLALKPSGYLLLNITSKHKYHKFDEDFKSILDDNESLAYVNTIQLETSVRTGSQQSDPIFVYKKKQ